MFKVVLGQRSRVVMKFTNLLRIVLLSLVVFILVTSAIPMPSFFLCLYRNLVPDNLVSATFSQTQTQYVYTVDWTACAESYNLTSCNSTNCSCVLSELEEYGANCTAAREKAVGTRDGINILGIIVFVIGFAIALTWVGEEGRTIVRVLAVLNEAIMKMVAFIMW